MALAFTGTARTEVAELRRFLAGAFGTGEGAPFLDTCLLEWKYFCERPGWAGARSYIVRRGDAIAAHGCAHPVRFLAPAGAVSSTRVIDWAAAGAVPGAGVLLLSKFAGLADTLLALGGSPETRAILPKVGFRHVGELRMYARPVRLWRQLRLRGGNLGRSVARLARNLAWKARPLAGAPAGWLARKVTRFGEIPVPSPFDGVTVAERTSELLNAMLCCPGAFMEGYEILREGATAGYFLLSRVRGQARIADLWVENGEWRAAYALAARAAAANPETVEVMAACATMEEREAIEAAGFAGRGSEPVFLYDPAGRLRTPLRITLLDGDEFYLDNPDYPFLT